MLYKQQPSENDIFKISYLQKHKNNKYLIMWQQLYMTATCKMYKTF